MTVSTPGTFAILAKAAVAAVFTDPERIVAPWRRLEDDLIAFARCGREVLGQQADRRLRIGAGKVEVGVELAADWRS